MRNSSASRMQATPDSCALYAAFGTRIMGAILIGVIAMIFVRALGGGGESEARDYGASFCPPPGNVLHIAGQTREDFDSYVRYVCGNGTACPLPAGVALYTNLKLEGLRGPHALAPGDAHQDLPYLLKSYRNMVLQIALYLHHSQLKEVEAGKHDRQIAEFAQILRQTDRPVFLRVGYEFDGPHNKYPPEAFRRAYRRIVERIEQAGATNVSYVWHSYALKPTFGNHDPLAWFPGDAYVNWVGISFFQVTRDGPFEAPNRKRLVAIAREKNLPVMICEAGPVRFTSKQKELTGDGYWRYWFTPFFDFIEANPEVKAFSIINCNWDSFSVTEDFGWGDCRINSDRVVLRNWQERMKSKDVLHSSRELYSLLGFRPTERSSAQQPAQSDN